MKELINIIENKVLFDKRLAFARALFAISALLTIIFNDTSELINKDLLNISPNIFRPDIYLYSISIFTIFSPFAAKIISISILVFAISGFLPQISCILQSWVHISMCNSIIVMEGGDQIAANLVLLLVPICLFDNRVNQWSEVKNIITPLRKGINVFFNIYFFLILLQVAVIYLHAGIGKLYNDEWKNGSCMYYWISNNVFGAPKWIQYFLKPFTLSFFAPIISWSVIFLELGLFACILSTSRKIKKTFLLLGIFFHLNIMIVHGLVTFFFAMFGSLILYLDNENYILSVLIKLKKKLIKTLLKPFVLYKII